MPGAWAGLLVLLAAAAARSEPGDVGGLEASMSSALLRDLRDARSDSPTPDARAPTGRLFRIKAMPEMSAEGVLPSWLAWDAPGETLQGVPLEEDRGVHCIGAGAPEGSSPRRGNAFCVEVREAEPLGTCGPDEAVTLLTVVLDADLTKMSSRQRVALLDEMSGFSGVEPRHMTLLPVVNDRLFDMSAFMAGPGNAKKVVENGALLSWKLGCSLEPGALPDLAGVQASAKEGAMSARLGYPVLGWHVANKKPRVAERARRQLNNAPTPVLTSLPPSPAVEPPPRVVPTPSSPRVAEPPRSRAPPARDPVPPPVRPTVRVRESAGRTPVPDPPAPTGASASAFSVTPSPTRPAYAEATPSASRPAYSESTPSAGRPAYAETTPPTTTRKPGKKPKKPKSTPTAPPRRPEPAGPSAGVPPDPRNEKPLLRNPIDRVNALVGTYFEVKIPSDTFFDKEDGTTDKLRLSLRKNLKEVVGESSWIQFNSTSQLLYGLPDAQHAGKHEYFVRASDKGGLSAVDAVEVRVRRWPANDKNPVLFAARLEGDPRRLADDVQRKILLVRKLAAALGDRNSSAVSLRNISAGSVLLEWTNGSLPHWPCPHEEAAALSRMLGDADGRPAPGLRRALAPEFRPLGVGARGRAACRAFSFIPPGEREAPAPPPAPSPAPGVGRRGADEVYLHTVVPAAAVAAVLLLAGAAAMICYRKKREGRLSPEERATFIKKGVPIIFADELAGSKTAPPSGAPLVLPEEKPPLPPPPGYAEAAAAPALRDEDPNAPPYQPPPPFATPQDGKGSRPTKNTTPYRSPPPYVPP
ncbi:dystroglycan 1 [Stigmatopora argus]